MISLFYGEPRNLKLDAKKNLAIANDNRLDVKGLSSYETLLNQYAGSGNFLIACYNKERNSIAIEKNNEMFEKMKDNIEKNLDIKFDELTMNIN